MVTVELAIGTITAVTVTACLVSLLMLGVAQAACAESSAQLARQSARGDEIAVAGARERAPDGARIRISRQADGVLAEVAVDVGVLGVGDVEVRAGHGPPTNRARAVRPRGRCERGSAGALLAVGMALATASVAVVAALLINWFAVARQAEQVAELAALAAVSAAVAGGDPCAAADAAAGHNGVAVLDCEVRGSGRDVVVEVAVRARLPAAVPGAPVRWSAGRRRPAGEAGRRSPRRLHRANMVGP
ncbi:hypothetical protein G7085_14560 [Tessaracoccus sp. HDW20]|uniref:hypothetical protein n=1 Tax=Tessaracoccus coleopterorum TaxID=2714950 RepID=UPI0018D3BDE5|nr:hypothetical protein [Tessaracoccus coleopterorum]NHB85427.1 hypothetical protein [Tessaracoccus coleopterorum]